MNKFASDDEKKNWAHILFVEHPDLFLPELEALKNQTTPEVDGLCKIFEEFQIFKKSRILDLSCGIGRHAIELAARGYQVVGYDPSNFFIDKAKNLVKSELDSHPIMVRADLMLLLACLIPLVIQP